MRKCEIVKSVSQQTGVERFDVELIIDAAIQQIRNNVSDGKTVHFRGFGSFGPVTRKAKKVRHIKANKQMILPERKVPHFKPSKNYFKIKEAVNV